MNCNCTLCSHSKSEHMMERDVDLYAVGTRDLCLSTLAMNQAFRPSYMPGSASVM